MISLKALILEAYPGMTTAVNFKDVSIYGLECDSRKIEKGFLFIALQGVKKDGSEFIEEALRRGAVAVVSEKKVQSSASVPWVVLPEGRLAAAKLADAYYGHPARKMQIIGITGTNGKTTASYLIEHFLLKQNKKTGVLGTINYRYAGKEVPATETTPGPLRIQKILAEMADAGTEYGVMEVSSHALDQRRVSGIGFKTAIFTNLTQDHLDYHGSLEAYFECKSRLFTEELLKSGCAVINSDDAWGRKLIEKISRPVISYAIEQPATLRATDATFEINQTFFNLNFKKNKIKILSPLFGVHNVYNVLAALATIEALGLDVEKAASDLVSFSGVPGRLESVDCGQEFGVFVDFAHTPDGLQNVLNSLSGLKKKKLIVVFGCGGDRDKGKRPKMAKIASQYCDFVYVTSDNPRSEDPKTIAQEVAQGFPAEFKNYAVVIDRKKAIRQALLSARAGDLVLLAGKGHERSQIVGSQILPFSDREEAERVLKGY